NDMEGTPKHAGRTGSVHILVVEDEPSLQELLKLSLEKAEYRVTVASDGLSALQRFHADTFQMVLLDIVMPGMDGFEVCTELRKRSNLPIIMVSALNRPDDIIRGFHLGADDYITKPFTFRELEIRIRAILRRIEWTIEYDSLQILTCRDLTLDDDLREVRKHGIAIHLTPIEYQLLRYLMHRPDRSVGKDELFQKVWGYELVHGTNLVEVAMHRLREKIEDDPSNPIYLMTVPGAGYKFCTSLDKALSTLSR
ncbi:MAG: response regulator transcription factor, partial [Caldilineaceae bacterium]|nr:response regulator transcription factor [Caldilineaceae bacterium]